MGSIIENVGPLTAEGLAEKMNEIAASMFWYDEDLNSWPGDAGLYQLSNCARLAREVRDIARSIADERVGDQQAAELSARADGLVETLVAIREQMDVYAGQHHRFNRLAEEMFTP